MPAIDALNQASGRLGGVDLNDPENDMGLFRDLQHQRVHALGQAGAS